jgi:hypothetical protein
MMFEVDPLKCPDCEGAMKILAQIDRNGQPDVVEKILKHGKLWREAKQRGPPDAQVADPQPPELTYGQGFCDREIA